jgi:hypothetical protein
MNTQRQYRRGIVVPCAAPLPAAGGPHSTPSAAPQRCALARGGAPLRFAVPPRGTPMPQPLNPISLQPGLRRRGDEEEPKDQGPKRSNHVSNESGQITCQQLDLPRFRRQLRAWVEPPLLILFFMSMKSILVF